MSGGRRDDRCALSSSSPPPRGTPQQPPVQKEAKKCTHPQRVAGLHVEALVLILVRRQAHAQVGQLRARHGEQRHERECRRHVAARERRQRDRRLRRRALPADDGNRRHGAFRAADVVGNSV